MSAQLLMTLNTCPLVFACVAFAFSLFYGSKSSDIFDVDHTGRPWAWKFQQFWLNFVGSAAGWLMLWVALRRLGFVVASPDHPAEVSDFILLLVAFIGITGFLPLSVVSFIQGIKDITGKVLGMIRERANGDHKPNESR